MCVLTFRTNTHMDVELGFMIPFGVVYFVLIVESQGREITGRTYYALLRDCTHTALEINSSVQGNPPIRAYCIPESVEEGPRE